MRVSESESASGSEYESGSESLSESESESGSRSDSESPSKKLLNADGKFTEIAENNPEVAPGSNLEEELLYEILTKGIYL